jgi:exosortase A-associated hydrolase 1
MDSNMRRALSFACHDQTLLGTLDEASGNMGILIVTGGRQTRIGPHRMMARLAAELADAGYSVFRFDRRGVGDSSGEDEGFRGSGPDIMAAIATFREACPSVRAIWGMGLCDGASALALHHPSLTLEGLILLNPWVVEAEAGAPPAAAIRAHYRERLLSLEGWRKLLTQGFSPGALLRGMKKAFQKEDQSLASDVMTSLAAFQGAVTLLLAERDATARAFLDQFRGAAGALLHESPNIKMESLDSASHSFASADDHAWLLQRIRDALPAR